MIQQYHFSVDIKANKEAIWNALWDDKNYRTWANVFFEGSYFVASNLNEGNTIHFLGPDKSGIFSTIKQHQPREIIHFVHHGLVLEGKEQELDEETKKWTGTNEIYVLQENDDFVTLEIDIDLMDEHVEMMQKQFPVALDIIKYLAEKH